jgi:3-hydroxyisobutyrate dehydrogenase-like beta-hydroxyacid dehydrogenase
MAANDTTRAGRRDLLLAATAIGVTALGSTARAAPEGAIRTIGVMSPGDMGQAVAIQLKAEGFRVCTALEHRSERTRTLAREAGLDDLGSLERLVGECDVVLSILDPGAALSFANDAAGALRATGRHILIADCNAIAPETAQAIAQTIEAAGGRFLDASIIGPPPRNGARTNLYVSGAGAADLQAIAGPQLLVHVIGDRPTDASALKMCYGAITKGTQAVWLEALIAAERLGVSGPLTEQLQRSETDGLRRALGQFPATPPKAYRWVPEMLQISKTFAGANLTPAVFLGAADMYRLVAGSPLARETPENRDRARPGAEVVHLLAASK